MRARASRNVRHLSRPRILKLLLATMLGAGLSPSTSVAQEADAAALAKAAQNPLASVISLPIQWNSNFSMGAEDRTQNVINLLPVFPFSLGSKLTLITRHILPIVNQPAITGDGPAFGPIIMPPGRPPGDLDRATGLGDYSGTFWLSPAGGGDLTWGLSHSSRPDRHEACLRGRQVGCRSERRRRLDARFVGHRLDHQQHLVVCRKRGTS